MKLWVCEAVDGPTKPDKDLCPGIAMKCRHAREHKKNHTCVRCDCNGLMSRWYSHRVSIAGLSILPLEE